MFDYFTIGSITEFKYLTGQKHYKSSLGFEFLNAERELYYPIPWPKNAGIYKEYIVLAGQSETFLARLPTYNYSHIDQVVGQDVATFKKNQAGIAEKSLTNEVVT